MVYPPTGKPANKSAKILDEKRQMTHFVLRNNHLNDVVSETRSCKSGDARNESFIKCFLSKYIAVIRYKLAGKNERLLETGFVIASRNGTVMHENTLLFAAAFIDGEVGFGIPG
jgi:hypothetical protein